MKLLNLPSWAHDVRHCHGFIDDFDHVVTADRWTSVLGDSGSVAVGDAAGGVVTLTPSDGTVANNDQTLLRTTAELFKFAADKPLIVEALLKFVEGNTDDVNIMFGLMNAIAADAIQDDGAGPKADYSGAVFFKVDGDTLWQVENSISTTQKTTRLTADASLDKQAKAAGGSSYQRLRIEWLPKTSTEGDFLFYVDDVLVAKHTDQIYTSATEMHLGFAVKNGADTTVEALLVDYVFAFQKR